jgi:endogenous inhibitor of DNA gyrase (YacG/DUF329 family)
MLPGIVWRCQDFTRFGNHCSGRAAVRHGPFQSGEGIIRFHRMNKPLQMPQPRGCPICGKPAAERLRPFCSRRCADVDLGRWLTGNYAIPAEENDDEADEPKAPPSEED